MFKPLEAKEFLKKIMQLAHDSRLKRLHEKKVILAIGAHPDDVEVGCAGTLAKHHKDGDALYILTLSQGASGGDSKIRKKEAETAAALQGAHLFLGDFTDTEIGHSADTIQFIENVVQQINPTHVYTHSFHDAHQDHQNAYSATVVACRHVPNLYCYLAPSSTIDFKPNIFINIDQFIEKKIHAINAYQSQSATRPYLAPDLIRATARYWGRFSNYHLVEPMEIIKGHA